MNTSKSIGLLLAVLVIAAQSLRAEEKVTALKPKPWDAVTFFKKPKPLPKGAVTEDWPRFLGATNNAISRETKLLKKWPKDGPAKVWEMKKGTGYTAPSIVEGRLYYFHRVDDKETLVCLHPETGGKYWDFDYAIDYSDRYGFNNGPRASPVVDDSRVYIAGVAAMLHCLDAKTGKLIWKKNLLKEYKVPQYFFGYGPTPLVWKDRVIANVGGAPSDENGEGVCVAAFDKKTGKQLWTVRDTWGASYSSPTFGKLNGKDVALVLAGGESRPAHGGLLVIDPASGKVHERFPWRADKYESVNASTPVIVGANRVYISETYAKGGVMLEFDANMKAKEVWRARDFGMHWMTPVLHDGHFYGFPGRNEPDASMACYDAKTGTEKWRRVLEWKFKVPGPRKRTYELSGSYYRGSLLRIDGSFLCLGELGTLSRMELTPKGVKEIQRVDLFRARETWALPVVSRGMLYVVQHGREMIDKAPPRLICYDLRAGETSAKE